MKKGGQIFSTLHKEPKAPLTTSLPSKKQPFGIPNPQKITEKPQPLLRTLPSNKQLERKEMKKS
jgi:hypothetical protein